MTLTLVDRHLGKKHGVRVGGRFAPPDPNQVIREQAPEGHELDAADVPPDCPWDFPPGSTGSRHGGRLGESQAPREWVERIQRVDPSLDLAFHPYNGYWVVWRYPIGGPWRCVLPVANPHTDEPVELDTLFLALLWSTDPARWGNAKQALLEVQERKRKEKEARERAANDRIDDAMLRAKRHTQISTLGRGNKFSKMEAGY